MFFLFLLAHLQGVVAKPPAWPFIHFDAQRTGRSPVNGPKSNATAWSFAASDWISSSPAIDGSGNLYFGSDSGVLYSLYSNGSLRWAYPTPTGSAIDSSPALAGGSLFFGGEDGVVYALLDKTGEQLWNFTTGEGIFSSPVVTPGGTVLVGSKDSMLYALEMSVGSLVWNFSTFGAISSSPALSIDGSIVYIADRSNQGHVYAVAVSTGVLKWRFVTDGLIVSTPAVDTDGSTVFVTSQDHFVYALDCQNGTKKWAADAGNLIYSSPAVGDSAVFFGTAGGVVAVNKLSGALLWKISVKAGFPGSPVVTPDNTVYIGSNDHVVRALDGGTGQELWRFSTEGAITCTPALAQDGSMYVGSHDTFMYAFLPPPVASALPFKVSVSVIALITVVGACTLAAFCVAVRRAREKRRAVQRELAAQLPLAAVPLLGPWEKEEEVVIETDNLTSPVATDHPSIMWESLKCDSHAPIKQGGWGMVLKASWTRPHHPPIDVAVKLFKLSMYFGRSTEDIAHEVRKEADKLFQIKEVGMNVVQFLGLAEGPLPEEWVAALGAHAVDILPMGGGGSGGGSGVQLGIVTRFVDGGTLQEKLHPSAPGTKVWAGSPVIHADIKPENVLLTRKGVPLWADFGLAAVKGLKASEAPFGALSTLVFTPGVIEQRGSWPYMAPELVASTPCEPNRSTDVFALGVLVWEVLCGENKRPWEGFTQERHAAALREGRSMPLEGLPDLPEVRDLVAACLGPREDRPKAAQIAARLGRYADELEQSAVNVVLCHTKGTRKLAGQVLHHLASWHFKVQACEEGAAWGDVERRAFAVVALINEEFEASAESLERLRQADSLSIAVLACLADEDLKWMPKGALKERLKETCPDLRRAASSKGSTGLQLDDAMPRLKKLLQKIAEEHL